MNKITTSLLGILLAVCSASCSVRTHEVIADTARSGKAILLPLQNPTICNVDNQWFMKGSKAYVQRHNRPCIYKEKNPVDKHEERYTLADDEFEPIYAPIPEDMATNLMKGKYTHTDAISFINRKWTNTLPEGKVKEVATQGSTPAFFRSISSHRMLQTENGSYLLTRIDEMTADFSSIYVYPLAGLSAILIDVPGSIILGPPSSKTIQEAQPEELE